MAPTLKNGVAGHLVHYYYLSLPKTSERH